MIVNCPNCSLEQPLDPFCAGCGKQLPKLIAEHKRKLKARNKRTQKAIAASVFFFSFGFYIYYAYQNPGARPFAREGTQKTTKITMSLDTITASKFQQKEFSNALKIQGASVNQEKKKLIAKPTPANAALIKQALPKISLQDFYIIDVESCSTDDVETGPLSLDELSFFLDCSKVILKLANGETTDIDPNLPFLNSISLKEKEGRLSLKFELAIQDPPLKTNSNIKLQKTESRSAGHLVKIDENRSVTNYIADKAPETLDEMLNSYALSRALKLTADDKPSPKGYFLAVYK